jgi:penicillin-binding protein 2
MVRNRIRILIVLLALPFLVVVGRLAALQLRRDPERDEELSRAEGRRRRIVLLPPVRGSILDRHGTVLARDVTTFDLEFNLYDLHPRERYLPVVERALDLCDDRCGGAERTASGEEGASGCRGGVLEEHLRSELAPTVLGAAGGAVVPEGDLVLVDGIPQLLRARLAQRLRLRGGLAALERKVGLYLMPSEEERTFELRVRPRDAMAMEIALQRIAEMAHEKYSDLRAVVSAAEAEVAAAHNATERDIARHHPRLLLQDVNRRALTEIIYQPELYPGIRVVDGSRRVYPEGEATGALTGYLRAPGDREIAEGLVLDRYPLDFDFILNGAFPVLRQFGSREGEGEVGARGIEEYYDTRLRGGYGARVEEVDARHKTRGLLLPFAAERGEDIVTSLDVELQKAVYQAFEALCLPRGEALAGSAVVMDLTGTRGPGGSGPPGAILAACGYPGYDPNRMRSRSYLDELQARQSQFRQGILLDRPVRVHQPPGSVFKLVVAAAAMEGGVEWPPDGGRPIPSPLSPSTRYRCTHFLDPANPHGLRCLSKNGHGQPDGEVDLVQALQYSCNIYFYHLGQKRLQPALLWAWARELGFGRSPGLDVDDPEVDPARFGRHLRLKGVTQDGMCQYAIGQGYVEASTLQVLRAVAGIARGGQDLPWPYLVTPRAPEKLRLQKRTVEVIQEGMARVVHSPGGTGSDDGLGLNRFRVALKTGTAELKGGDPAAADPRDRPLNCAWIAGYAPQDRPEIAFAVLLERTRLHGGDTAPVVVSILSHFAKSEPDRYLGPKSGRAGEPPAPPGEEPQ